jgi:hypothetical protein
MTPSKGQRWVSIVAALFLSIPAAGTTITGNADNGTQGTSMRGDLDGKLFVDIFAPADGASGRQASLSFHDGHFWSAVCVPCGFEPAAYWVRRVGDEIYFRGEMINFQSGSFGYSGVVYGNRLVATVD